MQKVMFFLLLMLFVIFNNNAVSADKNHKSAKTIKKKESSEAMSFQDIAFGTAYDVVRSKLKIKYPDILHEKNGQIILGDISSIDKASKSQDINDFKVFKIDNIHAEIKLIFDSKNKLIGYDIITLPIKRGVSTFDSMKELAEIIAYKFGKPDFITSVDERKLVTTVLLGQCAYMIGYAWTMQKYNAYIGVTSYYQEGQSIPLVLPFAEVINNVDDISVKYCFKKQYKYEYGDIADKATKF